MTRRSLVLLAALASAVLASPVARAQTIIPPLPGLGDGAGGSPTLSSSGSVAPNALAAIDPATGEVHASFGFALPAARGQAQPHLNLAYGSSTGVGYAGLGWTLDVPSIVRRGASGRPRFDSDVLGADVLSDRYAFAGDPLVPLCTIPTSCPLQVGEVLPTGMSGWTYFRSEVDDGMRFFLAPGGLTWVVQTKQGVTMTFGDMVSGAPLSGSPAIERSHEPLAHAAPYPVYRWNLATQTDASGNTVYYSWAHLETSDGEGVSASNDQGREYLTDIYDTAPACANGQCAATAENMAHHAHLAWSVDPRAGLRTLSPSWQSPPALTLSHVDVTSVPFAKGIRQLVRRYWLSYAVNSTSTVSSMSSIVLEGTCGSFHENAQGVLPATTGCPQVPALTATYTPEQPGMLVAGQSQNITVLPGPYMLADSDGDGIAELFGAPSYSGDAAQTGVTALGEIQGQVGMPRPGAPPLKARIGCIFGESFSDSQPCSNYGSSPQNMRSSSKVGAA